MKIHCLGGLLASILLTLSMTGCSPSGDVTEVEMTDEYAAMYDEYDQEYQTAEGDEYTE
ncbi:MAG: hypothetical protein AAGJ40_04670 [Planctomycetota bacterium]